MDRVSHLQASRDGVATAHAVWVAARDAVAATRLDARERAAQIELLSFQLGELDTARPQPDEDAQLAAARQVLASADRLQRLGSEAYQALYDDEHAALQALNVVFKRLDELAQIDPAVQPYAALRDGIKAQLDDVAFFLRSYVSDIEASPERLQEVEDRLALLDRLKRKYGPSLSDVLQRQSRTRDQLAVLQQPEGELGALQAAADEAAARYLSQSHALSAARRHAAGPFSSRLRAELSGLAMPDADVSFRFTTAAADHEWTAAGIDQAEVLLSANPGEAPRPLVRVASGGELSRVMLAIKVLDTPEAGQRTVIFDEVDAGIGGRVADTVGARLRSLSRRAQVLCVTHLPQVAAYADAHVQISKQVSGGRTLTSAIALSDDARVEELARMMAGNTSPLMLEGARALLASRAKGESEAAAKGESESPNSAGQRKGKPRGAKISV
ncbi:MAG: DNA repair protein RecN [Luteitalea sp.]